MTNRPDPNAAPPKKPDGKLSATVLWNAVRHYPLAFLGLLLLTAVAAAAVWLFLPLPKHTAAVVFQISGQPPRVINASPETQTDVNSYRLVQKELVKRRLVLNTALKELTKTGEAAFLTDQPDPLVWLDKYLQVDFRNGPEFMRVFLEGDNPEEMLAIIKAVTTAYKDDLDKRETGTRIEKLGKIDKALSDYKSEIEDKKKAIDSIAKSLNTTDADSLENRADGYRADINAARRQLHEVQLKLEQAKILAEGQEVVIPASVVDSAVSQVQAVVAAEGKVTAAKRDLAALQALLQTGAETAQVVNARNAVKAAELTRDQLRADVRKGVEAALKEKVTSDAQLTNNQRKEVYNALVIQKSVIESQVKDITAELEKHGQQRYRLETLQKDIAHKEKNLALFAQEKDQITIEKGADSRVTIHEQPFAAAGIEGFRRPRATLMVAAGVLVIGFAALVWWELRSRRVTRSDDLAQALGLPLLGTLPPWAAEAPGGHEDLVEAIDSTRTVLLHGHTTDRPLRTLVVTSALAGEGKTSLAGHLAISLTRAGYRTLLVDGDVRAPSAHKVFDVPAGPGLCEVLRGEADADEVVRDTKVPGLTIMPAGKWSLVARQALVGDRWTTIRRQLERRYDFVVLDTAPLLLTTDSLLLARGADGVVLSVLMGVSRLGSVVHTQERLASLGARVLGVVVNGARSAYPGSYDGRYEPTPDADAVPLTPA